MKTNSVINVISMGCSKNLVDSERLLRKLEAKGYIMYHNPENVQGEYAVVNTCGFIQDAKEESIDMILSLARLKEEGLIGQLIVMGCLSQRYMDELKEAIPEVDRWYGKFDWKDFVDGLPCLGNENPELKEWDRELTTTPGSCYLKISEGCNRFCAFCAIPIITGRHKSRPMEDIEEEVRQLVGRGVKEFNIIAQDLSSYGTDIYGDHLLAELIRRISDIPGVEWIRLHYAYPADFPIGLLDVMAERDNVCKYLDIALQHIADPVLENMRRHFSGQKTRDLIRTIREKVPGIKIRTTLMVGFPGEGEKEFQELMEFVKEVKFDRMGAFAYSEEEDTWAAKNLDDNIPQEVKQKRLDMLMDLQEGISAEANRNIVGQKVKVFVDRMEGTTAVGRTQWDSPEVDMEVRIDGLKAKPGEFINVEITKADEFDLFGRLA